MASAVTLPVPVKKVFSLFPLHTHPPVPSPVRFAVEKPTLWIAPPRKSPDNSASPDLLSTDVECLKWQAYIALKGLTNIAVRWDISPEGALDGRLPNLHLPASADAEAQLVAVQNIPAWVDSQVPSGGDALEGYKDQQAKDESHAWVSLLEGVVHATLVRVYFRSLPHLISETTLALTKALSQPTHSLLDTFIRASSNKERPIAAILHPPPSPLTGFTSLFPSFGANVTLTQSTLQARYMEAISALSERLGTDEWLLGSTWVTIVPSATVRLTLFAQQSNSP
ncbi:hypothetical protein ID866_3884 [Astraeus odoratus]|nr:hypothetical protein ID866_3884 [Astraeus odoratus]